MTLEQHNKRLFWGCFIALITTAFAFFTRIYLCNVRFGAEFGLDQVQVGELIGAGIWPFAISIILFSLIIDHVGYRKAMFFSFGCYVVYGVMAFMAYAAISGVTGAELAAAQAKGYSYLYWGSIILALGNGTVEAFINPVVATLFSREKTKWLNILHAGWPGGLVFGGILTIALGSVASTGDWRIVVGLIFIPAIIYVIMLATEKFPVSERVASGITYREMLGELGAFGAFVSFGLIFGQLGQVWGWHAVVTWVLTIAVTAGFWVYTRSFGRPIMCILILIMMPLATTELGTDGWITGLMEKPMAAAGHNPGWVLVYTSLIMMVLRFQAGSIVHRISPLGLLAVSSVLAIIGLLALSMTGAAGMFAIFGAATIYAFGKTFFWPTMLGVVSEQCPKGGALTLNAIAGIGMIAVGILGAPFIGYLQESSTTKFLAVDAPQVHELVVEEHSYILGTYDAVDPVKKAGLADAADIQAVNDATGKGQFAALGRMAMFPALMLLCYLGLIAYFKSRGGYKAVDIHSKTGTGSPAVAPASNSSAADD